jgi:pseudouridine-5'-phosphate glycosidase
MDLTFHPEVQEALARGRPVVALESTLITHGLPHPVNVRVAGELEAEVRSQGAVPATLAILEGRITIGLTDAQREALGRQPGVAKCSRRDLPVVLARGGWGSTTVAATMILAHRAGIPVFATGGIGGVHRGHPFDISADLTELGRIPITVVCAGAKAILDLPLTLEALETRGVPVLGYRTDEFPAFYSRGSGLPVLARCDDAGEIAAIIRARDALGLTTGILVAAPVPEEHELPPAVAEEAIQEALADADRQGVRGKEITPFLLARVSELTGAQSQQANIALLKNNARLAGDIAAALSKP